MVRCEKCKTVLHRDRKDFLCGNCRTKMREMDKFRGVNHKSAPVRVFKQMNEAEILADAKRLISTLFDMNPHGAVKHYRPGDPGFNEIARQYLS